MGKTIEISGDYGSGGGAIIRVASAMSAVTGKPFKINNIRANRPNPGLQTQHLEGIKAVAGLCDAKLVGGNIGSKEIEFYPSEILAKDITIIPRTAASQGLIFQILSLPSAFAEDKISIHVKGGSVMSKWAPPLIASKNILLPILDKMGYKADIKINKWGFYPAGQADVEFIIHPCKEFKSLNLTESGKMTHLGGISVASTFLQRGRVAERQARSAEQFLKSKGFKPMIKDMYVKTDCPGSGIVLWATDGNIMLGSDAIGERGKRAEDVGRGAAHSLLNTINSGSTVDEKISDQLLIFMALAKGPSKIIAPRLTEHAETNMWLIKKFLDVEFATKRRDTRVTVECSGRK